jgi:hypothetical protein
MGGNLLVVLQEGDHITVQEFYVKVIVMFHGLPILLIKDI